MENDRLLFTTSYTTRILVELVSVNSKISLFTNAYNTYNKI